VTKSRQWVGRNTCMQFTAAMLLVALQAAATGGSGSDIQLYCFGLLLWSSRLERLDAALLAVHAQFICCCMYGMQEKKEHCYTAYQCTF